MTTGRGGRFDQFRLEEQESYLESIPLLFYGLADMTAPYNQSGLQKTQFYTPYHSPPPKKIIDYSPTILWAGGPIE
jgi:hypothetical protein